MNLWICDIRYGEYSYSHNCGAREFIVLEVVAQNFLHRTLIPDNQAITRGLHEMI